MDTRQVLVLARVVYDIPRDNVRFDERGEQPRVNHRVFIWIILDIYCVYGSDSGKVERKAIPLERELGLIS